MKKMEKIKKMRKKIHDLQTKFAKKQKKITEMQVNTNLFLNIKNKSDLIFF
jgi:DNA-binding protein YbaB